MKASIAPTEQTAETTGQPARQRGKRGRERLPQDRLGEAALPRGDEAAEAEAELLQSKRLGLAIGDQGGEFWSTAPWSSNVLAIGDQGGEFWSTAPWSSNVLP
mmetsp:Transcript_164831/g.528913  ORF Transcript_164831/g.528913 Transcript_164831/m.528913 type:complete len:103 (+) Transcript_164831:3996-4304(+)